MAGIVAKMATTVVFLGLLVIVKAETVPVEEDEGTTFIKPDNMDADCLQDDKVTILKGFLPVHDELSTAHHEYRCQLPHGKKPNGVTDAQWNEEKGKTQYVTLYNSEDKIPIFSAYKAEPYVMLTTDSKETKNTGDRGKMPWEEAAGADSPKSSDYSLFKDYDRGHLFPVRLASDPIQAQATMKLTNAVPQNSVFNQNQWNWAGENTLMTTAVLDCQKKGRTPVLLTGAVPDYWGDLEKQDPKPKGLKIGRKTDSQNKGFPYDFPEEAFQRREDKIRVPTHMWSACFCVAEGDPNIVRNFLGFIGINLRVGHVKWYANFETFDATLRKMYRIKTKDKFFPQFLTTRQSERLAMKEVQDKMKELVDEAWKISESGAVKSKMELPLVNDNINYWDDAERSFENLIVKTIQQEINVGHNLLQQIYPKGGNVAATVTLGKRQRTDEDEEKGRPKKRQKTKLRKKRSVITSPVQFKYSLVKVVDASLTSDLSLTTCTFKETYDGGEETHELNLEEGVFIKDLKPTGEVEVSAVVNKIPVPERASTTQHISIVLTGRI